MGENVTVGRVALAHGNLNITIRTELDVSQPAPFSEQGRTVGVENVDINVGEEVKKLSMIGGNVTLKEVVKGLNSLGATPRDLISIFTAMKKSGALSAELVIM